jgi:hypothetical protein
MHGILAVLLLTALPRYWSVHVDIPSDRVAFEKIDTQFTQVQRDFYAEHHVEFPPLFSFRTANGAYYGLRPRGTLADFEAPSPLGDASKELRDKLAQISAATHELLRAHHNEIWQLDKDLTRVRDSNAPKYIVLRTDVVAPPDDQAYGTAVKQLIEEVTSHGVDVMAFFSAYGDGTHRYLFLSDQPLNVRKLGKLARTRDEIVTARDWLGD